jgi:3-oxosteroid 1-dehydrogenase
MLLRYYLDIGQRLRSRRDRFLTLGNAIIGQLKLAADRFGAQVWRHTALTELVLEQGRVTGAVVTQRGRQLRLRARRAVVLAGGGFERNAAMRAAYLPAPAADAAMSGSQINNTGDCITVGARAGAATLNLDSAWWAPVFKVPGEERGRLCAFERALPGCIIVNQAGCRYMNEAASYHVAAQRMMAADTAAARCVPSYIVFDSRYRRRYPMGPLLPMPGWLHSAAVRSTVVRARSWDELAQKLRVPPAALKDTIERFNAGARIGSDPQFARGASEYDRYCGDPKVAPNPTLAPLEQAPFYAMTLHLGDIGTNGGLATDAGARVLDSAGRPIAGLYAAGNTSASVMGHCYPGAGGTLGPALTFGYLAGLNAAGVQE